ncbi:MAG: TetR family transcriptional regulator [Proteobacteria bacterium]|nr:TetR family transcriptional regulator [Pseudomonadota bacterium]
MGSPKKSHPPQPDATTAQRILEAAVSEFADKGYFGARTQAIADAAGVNKALIHYYFRTKEKLYHEVLRSLLDSVRTRLFETFLGPDPLETRLKRAVDVYMDVISANPGIVRIIHREVIDGGHHLRLAFSEREDSMTRLFGLTSAEMLERLGMEVSGRPEDGLHIFINMVGMTVASFISPIVIEAVGLIETPDFNSYLDARRASIKTMFLAYARGRGLRSKDRS